MKKILAALLVLCILLCSFLPFAAAEEAATDEAAAFGVDMVIVLDMSGSMKELNGGKNDGNDVAGYRLDAAAMLIGMLDMDRSRVAVVQFNSRLVNVTELQSVSNSAERKELIQSIYNVETRSDTNIGAALMRANQILNSREDTGNQPAIILMTDGHNAIAENYPARIENSYRWQDGVIVDEGTQAYDTAMANQVTREAIDCAATLGYPIYTVALKVDPDEVSASGYSIRDISRMTGLANHGCWSLAKDNAEKLPEFFAEILADKIGSSIQSTVTPEPVEGKKNTYQIRIPVLNKSVRETNIIVPIRAKSYQISGIDATSIRILDPDGEVQSENTGTSVLTEEKRKNGHFALIKIYNPQKTGLWYLQFTSDQDPADVTFNILYNYDIRLASSLLQAGQERREFYKNDSFMLRANFSDEAGNASADDGLYIDYDADPAYEAYDEWMKLNVTWGIYPLDNNSQPVSTPVRSGKLSPVPLARYYESTVNLAEDMPKAGSYRLIVKANGAGLDREVSIPIVLMNHAPSATEFSHAVKVNSSAAGEESTWTVEGTSGILPKKADEIVRDSDGDTLSFDLRPEDGETQAAEMTLNRETGEISYTTLEDGGKVRSGSAVYRLWYDDGDEGGSGSTLIRLNIVSDVDEMLKKYTPDISTEGTTGPEGGCLKNTALTVSVRLKDQETGAYADAALIGALSHRITIRNTKNDTNVVTDDEMDQNGNQLEYRIDTGNTAAEWVVSVNLAFFDEPVTTTVSIPNTSGPKLTAEEKELVLYCDGEKVPSFLRGLIGEDTADDDPNRDLCTTALFTDPDNDRLEISEPVFLNPADGEKMDPETTIRADGKDDVTDGKHYLIEYSGETTGLFRDSYSTDLKVTAKDGDGLETTYTRRVTVVNLYSRMLTYLVILLIAVVLLIILILIIHQIRKPRFPLLNMTVREEPSLYESGSETLSPVKTPTNANAIGVDGDMAAKHNIFVEQLLNVIVKPVRSSAAVGVQVKKLLQGHEIRLEDVELKTKKQHLWRIGQELTIRNLNGEGLVAIKLEDRSDADAENDLHEFGSEDDWSSVNDMPAAPASGRRHSHKVQRKAAPAEEETSSGSNDDFDF